MKKLVFWAVALLSVICSCTLKEIEINTPEDPETELIQLTVRASIGETDGTKTAIQPNGTSIFWTPGDAINLFYGELSAGEFTTSITEPAQSAIFNGTISVATGTTEAGMSARQFWGVYPYNAANSCDGDGVILTIPAAQEGVPNTFADKLNPTVATSPGLDLGFYNVGSWFIFSVTQEDVVSATLSGNNNEDIAGTIRVTMDSNSRPVASVQSGAKSITITPQTGDSFEVGELYYMVLIPQTLSGGYTLTLTKADGSTAQYVNSNAAAFVRSQYRRKRNADDGLVYSLPAPTAVDLGLSVKWANFNLGAGLPERRGHYYAWGETMPYYISYDYDNPGSGATVWREGKPDGYYWSSYQFGTSNNALTKYNVDSNYGTVDNKTVLDSEDDAAHVKLGDKWHIPTMEDWNELLYFCTWTATTLNGVDGYQVTGPNDNSIFIPATGLFDNRKNFAALEYMCYYWSASLCQSGPYAAWHFDVHTNPIVFNEGERVNSDVWRISGLQIRPVYGDTPVYPESISLNKSSLSLTVDHSEQLTATISPLNVTVNAVVWQSANSAVATVDAVGNVTAVKSGQASIIVKSCVNNAVSATCVVTVLP